MIFGTALNSIRGIHELLSWVIVIGNGVAGLWALLAHQLPKIRHYLLWWVTAIAQLAIVVEVSIGVGLMVKENIDTPQFHLFYGFVAFITVGIAYSYRQSLRQYQYLLYGGSGLFLMGLGIRAMFLGSG
ncbi:MAG: hypothetical protein MB54_02005 [marine actinobacterium MedAcidi-G2B]|nr:MAG: hypothetical protein MB54_02005 [marine actinobacterium MedAcidi-G2B]MAU50686.1 hypothetical protein [Actinomycetota bacterium]MDC0245194.1 hypothetical protein [Acidimicrobiaceae bacterium]|tara:strand:+ start:14839 stop:15225 length:387 start_codon:yes stop_codon:yes gene_type:complete